MPKTPDFALTEEETFISDQLGGFLKEQMERFFSAFPEDKRNPMIAFRSAGNLLSYAVRDIFTHFPNAREASLNEVQFIMRRITEWRKYTEAA